MGAAFGISSPSTQSGSSSQSGPEDEFKELVRASVGWEGTGIAANKNTVCKGVCPLFFSLDGDLQTLVESCGSLAKNLIDQVMTTP